ncbi:hypothetical protein [Lacrimispora sp.]|uniref:hypothetical protein n=1 Tax=Lacrimispora sp. TaxID=2719234 RepID=UPI0039E4F789
MTDLDDSLGITVYNYPVINGSISTLIFVQAIYQEMYSEEGYTDSIYSPKASKTVPSYLHLIGGDMVML